MSSRHRRALGIIIYNVDNAEKEGESVGVVRDISFVSPSVRIESSETIRKSVAEQQDEREEEEKGTDKYPHRAFVSVCSILDSTVRSSISCTMYKVTTSFEVSVLSMMNVVFQSLESYSIERGRLPNYTEAFFRNMWYVIAIVLLTYCLFRRLWILLVLRSAEVTALSLFVLYSFKRKRKKRVTKKGASSYPPYGTGILSSSIEVAQGALRH